MIAMPVTDDGVLDRLRILSQLGETARNLAID
jgi:hypothetical protein